MPVACLALCPGVIASLSRVRRRVRVLVSGLAVAFGLAAPALHAAELMVSVAASLSGAVREVADADEVEEALDDESIDVIVGSTAQDLVQLVEDEVLLSLPQSPRHEICPGEAPTVPVDKPESPFAVLKKFNS